MSKESKFKTSKEAKDKGWFSRRHQTNEAHLKAKRLKNKQKKE